jgi:hypothetical protein
VCGKVQANRLGGLRGSKVNGECKMATWSAKGTIEEIKPVWDFLVTW